MSWLGSKNISFVLASSNDPRIPNPPADWKNLAENKIFHDYDLLFRFDKSFAAYIQKTSYGKASVTGKVFGPYDGIDPLSPNGTFGWDYAMTDAIRTAGNPAVNPTPNNNSVRSMQGLLGNISNVCVIFPGTASNPYAFYGNPQLNYFYPGSYIFGSCYVNMDDPLGPMIMENIHSVAWFGDLYKTTDRPPGLFDEMDCACGTHPSSFTKLKLGWIDPNTDLINFVGPTQTVQLRALALSPQAGQVHTIKIPSKDGISYYLVESRLKFDHYEKGFPGVSCGIPNEGVVIYWINEQVWAPVHLVTPIPLVIGESIDLKDEGITIRVVCQTQDGFNVQIFTGHARRTPKFNRPLQKHRGKIFVPSLPSGLKNRLHGSLGDAGTWILTAHGPVPVPPWQPKISREAKIILSQIHNKMKRLRELGDQVETKHKVKNQRKNMSTQRKSKQKKVSHSRRRK